MTFRKRMEAMCVDNGMFDTQAEKVVQRAVNESRETDEANEDSGGMFHRWDDDEAGYPLTMTAVLWMCVCRHALEFIKEECPNAWFRPMFDKEMAAKMGI